MTTVIWICGGILTLAAAGSVYRIFRGPTLLDRVLATDVLLAIVMAALCVDMVARDSYKFVTLLVVLAMIGFVGSVTVARYADNSPSGEKKLKPSRLQARNPNRTQPAGSVDPERLEQAEAQAEPEHRVECPQNSAGVDGSDPDNFDPSTAEGNEGPEPAKDN